MKQGEREQGERTRRENKVNLNILCGHQKAILFSCTIGTIAYSIDLSKPSQLSALFTLPGPCHSLSLHSHFHVGGAAGMVAKADQDCHSHCDHVLPLEAHFPK